MNKVWIQDKVRSGEVEIEKVGGKDNIADALKKEAGSESLRDHIQGVGMAPKAGRHELAPQPVEDEEVRILFSNSHA